MFEQCLAVLMDNRQVERVLVKCRQWLLNIVVSILILLLLLLMHHLSGLCLALAGLRGRWTGIAGEARGAHFT